MNKFQPLYLRMFFFLQQNFKYDSADHTISRYTSEILSKIIIFFFFLYISLSNWNQIRWLGRTLCPDSALFIKLILSLLCDMIHYSAGHSQQNILNCCHKGIHIIIKKYSDKTVPFKQRPNDIKKAKVSQDIPMFLGNNALRTLLHYSCIWMSLLMFLTHSLF